MKRRLFVALAVALLGCGAPAPGDAVAPVEVPRDEAALVATGWSLTTLAPDSLATQRFALGGAAVQTEVSGRVARGLFQRLEGDPTLRRNATFECFFAESLAQYDVNGRRLLEVRDLFDNRAARATPTLGRALLLMVEASADTPVRVRASFALDPAGERLAEPAIGHPAGTPVATVLDRYAAAVAARDAGALGD